jgi:hypothetical protein
MGFADDTLGTEQEPKQASERTEDGQDPFAEANALPVHEVLTWLGVELDGDRVPKCPGCGATSGVAPELLEQGAPESSRFSHQR